MPPSAASRPGSPAPRPEAGRDPESGFTLAELLVALLILSLMAGMLAGGIGVAGAITTRQRTSTEELDAVVNAQRLLAARLATLVPVPRFDAGGAVVNVNGTARAFRFVAPAPPGAEPDTLRHYWLRQTEAGDLVLQSASIRHRDIDLNDPAAPQWETLSLLSGVAAVRLAYFGEDRMNPGRRWLGFWRDRQQPPELIRVSVDFAPADRRRWPDLVVRPRATVNTLCRIDAMSGRCEASA
jgi:general secretion pathway protein J